jgi:hypothetical protein
MTSPQYIGIDLHRRRSVAVRMDADGEVLSSDRIDNGPEELQRLLARTARSSWRPHTAGTGRWTRARRLGPVCTWPTRWGSTRSRLSG